MTIFHQNAQCLSNKCTDFEVFFDSEKCDVFCVSEHWFMFDAIASVDIHGFTLTNHYGRSSHMHGGVAIFTAPHLQAEAVELIRDLCVDIHFEAAACKFSVGSLNVIVLALYRSGKGDRAVFLAKLDEALELLGEYKNHLIVVCGDFNYDFLTQTHQLNELLDLLHANNLTPTIHEPTRYRSCLDNICVTDSQCIFTSKVVQNAISDHHGQVIKVNYSQNIVKDQSKASYRQINNPNNIKTFRRLLAEEGWSVVFDSVDVNIQYTQFHHLLCYYYNLAFPVKHKIMKPRKDSMAWITTGIRISSRRLKELFLLVQSGDEGMVNFYKKYKATYRRVIRAAKRTYYNRLIQTSKNKVKTAWQIINSDKPKTDNKKNKISLIIENTLCTDHLQCANHLNTYFTTVADRFVNSIHKGGPNDIFCNDKSFFLTPVRCEEVFREFLKLKPSPSYGFDHLSAKLLRNCAEEICLPLTHIINQSFQTGIFPSLLKTARCVPIYKKNDAALAENYRPISVLSTFSKLFEKLFCARLLDFFNQHRLFNNSQHGFRSSRSTTTAIVDLLNKLYFDLDRGQNPIGIFLDLTRAFDLVNHDRLLDKLSSYGVRGVPQTWLRSYLHERKQYVEICGVKSETLTLDIGVPQGSVIGPLLYIVYTGDICLSNLVMYADDTTILAHGNSIQEAVGEANSDLERVCNYFNNNNLVVNKAKSVCIKFSMSSASLSNSGDTAVCLDGDPLEVVDVSGFLGVQIDGFLRWHEHIDLLCKKLASLCFTVKRLREFIDTATLKSYYYARYHSLLSYGIVAWGSCSATSRVLILQKRAIRYMFGMGMRDSCRPLFRKHKIMTVVSVYVFQMSLSVRVCACNYRSLNAGHSYSTRNGLLLEYPIHRTSAFESSPHYMSIRCYNKLPSSLKMLNVRTFKENLRSILIDKAYYSLNEFFNDNLE